MLVKIIARMDRACIEPCIVSLFDQGTMGSVLTGMGVEVVCLRMNTPMGILSAPLRLAGLIRRQRFAAIQGWMYHGSLMAWAGRLLAGSRAGLGFAIRHTLYDVRREHLNTRAVIWAICRLARRADACLFNSWLSLNSHKDYGYCMRRAEVIPNGFEIKTYSPDPDKCQKLRALLGLEEVPVVGMVARFDPAKDHENFLRAAAIVHQRAPKVRFILVGTNVTPENHRLMTWIETYGLSSVIMLLGERSDIADLNNLFDVACLSSWMEAFPNVVGEAMACGTPCVVTDVGDSRAIVGAAGRVVPPRNSDALAAAILDLLSLHPDQRRDLGTLARTRVVEHFDMSVIAEAYMQYFDRLIVAGANR